MLMDQDRYEVYKHAKKKNEAKTEQTWSIKDILYGKRTLLSSMTQEVVLSRQDGAILPARVASLCASRPLTDLSI